MDSIRIDRWLWAVRLFKTRSSASDACRGGHVRINGARVKPAGAVKVGDKVSAHTNDRQREVEVTRLIPSRVGAAIAVDCYIDHSPAPISDRSVPPPGRRERGAGRPTKRERRQLEKWRGR